MVEKEKAVKAKKTTRKQTGLSQINKRAAGVDIGSQQHYVQQFPVSER